jgi:hypothetical protein
MNKADQVYRQIYDRQISLADFRIWLSRELQLAYDRGVRDADAPPSYDEVSRSQYD